MMSFVTRKNWGSIQKLIVSLCLGLSPSCSEGSADETKDRYREIVDISRDEAALKEYGPSNRFLPRNRPTP